MIRITLQRLCTLFNSVQLTPRFDLRKGMETKEEVTSCLAWMFWSLDKALPLKSQQFLVVPLPLPLTNVYDLKHLTESLRVSVVSCVK